MKIRLNSNRITERYQTDSTPLFGSIPTAHMFVMDGIGKWDSPYKWVGAWDEGKIIPFQEFNLTPDSDIFNYGAGLFEGGKFNKIDGKLYIWRPEMNAARMKRGANRIMLPSPSVEAQLAGYKTLIDIDRLYFPELKDGSPINGASGYIRPILIGTEKKLGVKYGALARFAIYIKMGGPYFTDSIKLWLQDEYHRGINAGEAKLGGNYAMHVFPKAIGTSLGANEVLYLDYTKRFLRETGASNIFVDKNWKITFPPFGDGVLDSNTVKTFLELRDYLAHEGVMIENQREFSLEELIDGIASNEVTGMGCVGNAACVSPVKGLIIKKNSILHDKYVPTFSSMRRDGKIIDSPDSIELIIGNGQPSKASKTMYHTISGMQRGTIPAPEGWLKKIERIF
ncbi:hypothetical protein COV12_03720 [Candidatus Woesearchaeota archaeon CG10_big_fil_rev_8_21_14_0_10_32_24]|nr:MAG: hypothetical protein COV12_03720 [Candidatus Woesearchaeota archaeon CG10_big_fil_rev_8_21_14_0_10_32_24]